MGGHKTRGGTFVLLLLTALLLAKPASAQASPPDLTKPPTFDVVSIKPSSRSLQEGGAWGFDQNKFSARNVPLGRIILSAYLGQLSAPVERLIGAPSWVMNEPYYIVAKADDATAESWRGLRQEQKAAIAAPLLRALFADRCKLVAPTVPIEVDGYELTVAKHGIRMQEAQPGEPVPGGAARFEGGWSIVFPKPGENQSMNYYGVTMTQLIAFLSMGRNPIVDRTGLKGKYNFTLPRTDMPPPQDGEPAAPPLNLDAAHMFNWAAIGLEMKPIKVPALNLVVDHIERPTEN